MRVLTYTERTGGGVCECGNRGLWYIEGYGCTGEGGGGSGDGSGCGGC